VGGLAPDATVMSWSGTLGVIEAARQGHDVIMTPGTHMYFDHYQGEAEHEPLAIGGFNPLKNVYSFEPVPEELTDAESVHVLGSQANVWTEYMLTSDHVEYMAYPRALALAEILWSPKDTRDWGSFVSRLPHELEHLDRLGVNYRLPDVSIVNGDQITVDDAEFIKLNVALNHAQIRYTLDGTDPSLASTIYEGPFRINSERGSVTIRARAFHRNGRSTAPATATFPAPPDRETDQQP
jgi:hexosaminidase